MPTLNSATTAIPLTTYPTQQTQSRLPMAIETISWTLTESAPQYEITQELAQPPEGSGWRTGSVPFGAKWLGSSQYSDKQVHAAITNAFNHEEQEMEEVEETLLVMTNLMEDLPTKSPMATTSRTWSPSPKPMMSRLWDHSPESSMETKPKPKPSSPNSLGTSCSTIESQDSNLLFDKLH